MSRNPHFAVDDLSEAARAIVRHGIEQRRRESAIIADVKAQTGERISTSSFNRYASWYRVQLRRREAARESTEVAVETAEKLGMKMTEGIRAELLQSLTEAAMEGPEGQPSKLKGTSPYLLGCLALKFMESARKDKELAQRIEEHELNKRKAEALEAKQKAIDEKVKKAVAPENKELTEDEKRRIRSIYGTE